MEPIAIKLKADGRGRLLYQEEGKTLGEMDLSVDAPQLTVYHTEVQPEAEGRGLAKKMLEALVAYARESHLKISPLCPFVHAQFKRHPEMYADIWLKQTI